MTKQRREGEADGPQGQRPARVSRRGPSWTEFVRLAHQAVVAFAGAEMINREQRERRKRGQDLMAICHDARKGRNTGGHWSRPVAPPLHSTSLTLPRCERIMALKSQ